MNSRSALPRRRIKVHDGYVFIERRKRKKNRVVSHVSSVSINFSSVSSPSSFSFPFTPYFECTLSFKFFESVELRKEQQFYIYIYIIYVYIYILYIFIHIFHIYIYIFIYICIFYIYIYIYTYIYIYIYIYIYVYVHIYIYQ